MTLSELSTRTGIAASTLSKLEVGHLSLSYDKLAAISRGLNVDMAALLTSSPASSGGTPAATGNGRRVVHRAGHGKYVATQSYKQWYLATELLNKRMTPMIVELEARTMDDFRAEFGDFIRHPGEEFVFVIEGEVEFCSELYEPLRLYPGDTIYFDSEMGHAYLKGTDERCRIVAACAPRGATVEPMIQRFVSASEALAAKGADSHEGRLKTPVVKRRAKA